MAVCFKCKLSPAVVCSRDGPNKSYCSLCFTDFCTRLTRDSLFRNCGLPCDEPVVVAVSGGFSSMMLLHQLGILRVQNRIRRGGGCVVFQLLPLHLREEELMVPVANRSGDALEKNDGARNAGGQSCGISSVMSGQFDELESLIRTQSIQWDFACAPLFTPEELRVVRYSDYLSSTELRVLHAVLHHPRIQLTHRELLYTRLRGRVLTVAAVEYITEWRRARQATGGWYHMVTGENALRCSLTALREVVSNSDGNRMAHLSGYRGFLGQCVVMRPLRTLIPREAVMYCRLHSVRAGFTPSLSTLTSLRSVDRALESFLISMLNSYRTSVFNVLNTVTRFDVGDDAEVLEVDLQYEQNTGERVEKPKQAKRVITGKAAQHHREQLSTKQPIRCVWGDAGKGGEGQRYLQSRCLCLVCGCPTTTADERHVTLCQRARLVCEACFSLLSDLAGGPRAGLGTSDGAVKTESGGEPTVAGEVQGTLSAFDSLVERMQMLVEVAGNSSATSSAEERCVRRRLSIHDVDEYILPGGDGDDDGS